MVNELNRINNVRTEFKCTTCGGELLLHLRVKVLHGGVAWNDELQVAEGATSTMAKVLHVGRSEFVWRQRTDRDIDFLQTLPCHA